ncbi:MAG: tRNA uridine-5-carboxymethylaminomethyl(34) synthesis GTPase MnmE, partial [Burkholderiaceae bacterium]|nr:tRNA uridine-5-carboxymethylaminomethyl(34) synthesis GTPase MnmE [Burkholderiaceae bacterium]
HIIDTAGLRDGAEVDEVERIGIERAWQRIEAADAVLFVHDLTRAADPAYQQGDAAIRERLASRLPARVPVIDVWNKADAAEAAAIPTGADDLPLSARTGAGLPALRERLLHAVGWSGHTPEGLFSARQRHVDALHRVRGHLQAAQAQLDSPAPALELLAEELRLAHEALGTITGAFGADDLLGVIFSRFCIGK